VRYLPPPATSLPPPSRAVRPALIVFPYYAPAEAGKLQPLSAADGLGRLLGECLAIPRRLDLESVAAVIETMERAPCWALAIGHSDQPAREVMRLMKGLEQGGDE